MDPLFAGGALVGGGAVGIGALALALIRRLGRLEREIAELKTRMEQPEPADILAAAQAEARNRQLAILAAVDLADYVAQNFDGAGTEIVKRIAPHLLERK